VIRCGGGRRDRCGRPNCCGGCWPSGIPRKSIKILASANSAGKPITFRGQSYTIEPIRPRRSPRGSRAIQHTVGPSRESPDRCQGRRRGRRQTPPPGAMTPTCRWWCRGQRHALTEYSQSIVANPNCVAIPAVRRRPTAARLARVKRVVVATYHRHVREKARRAARF